MSDILVVGWITLDFIGKVPSLPTVARAAYATDFDAACGGRGANQAMAVTAVEGDVALIARIGSDQHAGILTAELADLGIDADFVTQAPAATGMRMIAVQEDGAQSMIVYGGANEYLTVDDLNRRAESFRAAKAVGVTSEPPGAVTARALELAAAGDARSLLTYTPGGGQVSDRVLASADAVVVSATASGGLLDPAMAQSQPEHAARFLCQRGAKTVLLLAGSVAYVATPDALRMIPSPAPLEREESVDAFCAGVLVGMARGEEIAKAAVRGVRVSCLLVD